jgi:hypothetical protein
MIPHLTLRYFNLNQYINYPFIQLHRDINPPQILDSADNFFALIKLSFCVWETKLLQFNQLRKGSNVLKGAIPRKIIVSA